MPAYSSIGYAALLASRRVLEETEDRLKTLLLRGDLSTDAADEQTTVKWLMRVTVAKKKVKTALRSMDLD